MAEERELGVQQRKHQRIRSKSRHRVKSGRFPEEPCLVCGSRENLTIHHLEPVQYDRFVFLCKPCHVCAHRAVYRRVSVPLGYGQFSILREAAVPGKEVCRG